MPLDERGRPSPEALLAVMKRDMDEQISRLNDNRIFLIAAVDELQAENEQLKTQLSVAQERQGDLADQAAQAVPVLVGDEGDSPFRE